MNVAFNRDCLEAMREFPAGFFDLAVVDPPYGIGYDRQAAKTAGEQYGVAAARKKTYHATDWDNATPPPEYFAELFRVSKKAIIWGAIITSCRRASALYAGINVAAIT